MTVQVIFGQILSVSKTETDQPKGWEYLTFILHFRRGEAGWVAQQSYPAPLAQQSFWNDAAPIINEIRTMMIDNGWQPVGEHGPACIELESYKSTEGQNPVFGAIDAVRSLGASLLFSQTWKFTMKSLTLRWRRPKMKEGTEEDIFHMWFNPNTGELERWDFDKTTNKWIPMDVDEDGNWFRKQ